MPIETKCKSLLNAIKLSQELRTRSMGEAVKEFSILGQRLLSLKTKMPILDILRLKLKPRKLKLLSSFTASEEVELVREIS